MMRSVHRGPVEVGVDMAPTDFRPSPRLVRAADAERDEIERRRKLLGGRRDEILAELAEVEASLATLGERQMLLARLVPTASGTRGAADQPPPSLVDGVAAEQDASAGGDDAGEALRGPAIRDAAVKVLARSSAVEAIHYRAWYEMLVAAGYRVAGKDPLAVFLTQITRSPVVRKSTQAGVYALDLEAPIRLRRELASLESQLRQVTTDAVTDLTTVRERREQVLARIRQAERALAEAERVLGGDSVPTRVAAG
jgi:hypothetical protein